MPPTNTAALSKPLRAVTGPARAALACAGLACAVGCAPVAPILVAPSVAATPPPGFSCTRAVGEGDYEEYPTSVDIAACSDSTDVRDVLTLVLRAVRAEHVMEGYEGIWGEGAAGRTAARLPEPEACEVTLAPEAAQRWLSAAFADFEDDSLEVGLTRVEGVVHDDTATVRAEVELRVGYGEDMGRYVHQYELRRSGAAWTVHHVRLWVVDWAIPDESETFDSAFWAAIDADTERARQGCEGLAGDALLDAQRAYAAALQRSQCPREAHALLSEVVRAPSAHADDWNMLADSARNLGHFAEADAATTRARQVPLGPPAARTLLGCWNHASTCPADDPDADEEDCLPRELCEVDVLGRVDVPTSGDARALAVVRERRDEAGAENVYLVIGAAGAWTHAILLEEGPRHDGAPFGVQSLTVEAPQLATLGSGWGVDSPPRDGMTLRYEHREREAADAGHVDIIERGVLACLGLGEDVRCERLPDVVERQPAGGRARRASATLTFPGDGSVVVRALSGRDPRIVTGQRPILTPPTP